MDYSVQYGIWANMLQNYFKIALRNFLRYKLYSIINLSGLALGMACFLIISLWCLDELSYDKFHENNNRLYRINSINEEGRIITNSSLRLGGEMKEKYAEIEAYTNLIPWARSLMKYGDFSDVDILITDSSHPELLESIKDKIETIVVDISEKKRL